MTEIQITVTGYTKEEMDALDAARGIVGRSKVDIPAILKSVSNIKKGTQISIKSLAFNILQGYNLKKKDHIYVYSPETKNFLKSEETGITGISQATAVKNAERAMTMAVESKILREISNGLFERL